ncbi:hypothetical protein PIB30_098905, partial [Stylosanthes scabra]|nr:hypothetical protein [Stylosanthes scabra]
MFMWQHGHNCILTASKTARWSRNNNPYCSFCQTDIETPIHAIRDCPLALLVW